MSEGFNACLFSCFLSKVYIYSNGLTKGGNRWRLSENTLWAAMQTDTLSGSLGLHFFYKKKRAGRPPQITLILKEAPEGAKPKSCSCALLQDSFPRTEWRFWCTFGSLFQSEVHIPHIMELNNIHLTDCDERLMSWLSVKKNHYHL